MRWTEYAVAMLLFSVVSMLVLYADAARCSSGCRGIRRASPRVRAGPRVQHRRVVHDQHQLAGLQRRVDDELSHADGRARVPQLRVGGGRHRAGDRVHPRHRAEGEGHASATSGSTWSAARCGCCCRSASSARCVLVSQGVVQNLRPYDKARIDPQTVASTRGKPQTSTGADDRAGAGRVAGDHQAVRHQRRRLLQRQQRASVREPDAAHELPRDVRHLRDLGRASPTRSAR